MPKKPKFLRDDPSPGDAYVRSAQKFADLVFQMCNGLPKKWRDYILDPVFADADTIEKDVVKANRIPMDQKTLSAEELLKNLDNRIQLIDDAILTFDSFDMHFDRLMSQFDLLDTDIREMTEFIRKIIAKADPDHKTDICVHGTDRFFSYTADADGEKKTVHFTRQKKDQILDAEDEARKQISARRSADRQYRKALMSQLSS